MEVAPSKCIHEDEVQKVTNSNAGLEFRLRICLKRLLKPDDERALCYVWVSSARSVRSLRKRVRRLARASGAALAISRRLRLVSNGYWLPPDEPLAILRPDDLVEVVPVEADSREHQVESLEEENIASTSNILVSAENEPKVRYGRVYFVSEVTRELPRTGPNYEVTNGVDCELKNGTDCGVKDVTDCEVKDATDNMDVGADTTDCTQLTACNNDDLRWAQRRALALLDAYAQPPALDALTAPARNARRRPRVRRRPRYRLQQRDHVPSPSSVSLVPVPVQATQQVLRNLEAESPQLARQPRVVHALPTPEPLDNQLEIV